MAASIAYTSGRRVGHRAFTGGTKIAEVLRRAWSRLARKQWLILYPLAVAVIDTLAFFAIYSADGDHLAWTRFFAANFDRWQYLHDHLFSSFAISSALGMAILAGFIACLASALIRAPYFRAITGARYPLAPRGWKEVFNLLVFYIFYNVLAWVIFLPAPQEGFPVTAMWLIVEILLILVIFADYVIVFEELGFLGALRRSLQLLRRRWLTVVLLVIVVQLVVDSLARLYQHYYDGERAVFILLPVSQILLQAFITLIADLLLIFLYEDIRRESPA